jgi:hypothetical protein
VNSVSIWQSPQYWAKGALKKFKKEEKQQENLLLLAAPDSNSYQN